MESTAQNDFTAGVKMIKQAQAILSQAQSILPQERENAVELARNAFELLAVSGNSYYIHFALRLLFSEAMARGGEWADTFLNRLQTLQQTYNVAHYPVANLELQHFVAQTNRYTGQTAKSAELYKACIEESDRLNYTGYGYVEMLIGITFNYMLLADYEKAYYCIVRAEALAGVEKNPLQLATVYYYRAGIDRQLSANHDAVLYLVKASRLAKQSGELMLIVAIAEELASTLYSIGKERYAIRIYEKALTEGEHAYSSILECAESLFSAYYQRLSLPDMKRVFTIMQATMHHWSNKGYDALFLRQQLIIAMMEDNAALANDYAYRLGWAVKDIFTNRDKLKCLLSLALYYEKIEHWQQAADYYKQHYEVSKMEQTTIVAERIKSLQIQTRINSIKQEKERVENMANARRDFFSQVSHEIRSPMNAVIALSSLLSEEPMAEDQKQKITIIKRSSENLLMMINDLLDNAKIEAGKFTIESVPFSLPDLLNDVVALLAQKAAEKGIELLLDCSEGLPAYLSGDPTRLRQVLVNLLNNAVKFTPQGSVTLKVEEHANGAPEKTKLHFTVRDTGIGIAAEQLGNIFSGYMQASANTARNYGGTGLGLKISKELVQLMGGILTVESSEGSGSTFSFSLPFTISQPPGNDSTNQEFSYTGAQTFSFLIADDLEDNRYVFKMLLENIFPNSVVTLANDGMQAVNSAIASNYDLIVMDIDMPVMNGIEAAMKILTGKPQQKILGSSANVILEAADLKGYGFEGFIPKPFTKKQFAETLRELLAGRL